MNLFMMVWNWFGWGNLNRRNHGFLFQIPPNPVFLEILQCFPWFCPWFSLSNLVLDPISQVIHMTSGPLPSGTARRPRKVQVFHMENSHTFYHWNRSNRVLWKFKKPICTWPVQHGDFPFRFFEIPGISCRDLARGSDKKPPTSLVVWPGISSCRRGSDPPWGYPKWLV